jgi:hypothetical protein
MTTFFTILSVLAWIVAISSLISLIACLLIVRIVGPEIMGTIIKK